MQLWLKTTDQDIVPLNGRTSERVWFQCMSCVIRSAKHSNYAFQFLFPWLCFLIFFHLFQRLATITSQGARPQSFMLHHRPYALWRQEHQDPPPRTPERPRTPHKMRSINHVGAWTMGATAGKGGCWVGSNPNNKRLPVAGTPQRKIARSYWISKDQNVT